MRQTIISSNYTPAAPNPKISTYEICAVLTRTEMLVANLNEYLAVLLDGFGKITAMFSPTFEVTDNLYLKVFKLRPHLRHTFMQLQMETHVLFQIDDEGYLEYIVIGKEGPGLVTNKKVWPVSEHYFGLPMEYVTIQQNLGKSHYLSEGE